jgi:predicted MPP superfamily phosphohydrolase
LGIESVFLRELPGVGFMLFGILAQLYLIRVLFVQRGATPGEGIASSLLQVGRAGGFPDWRQARALWALVVCQLLLFAGALEPFSIWLRGRAAWPESVLLLWWWSIAPAALALWLWRQFPAKPFNAGRRAVLRTSLAALAVAPAAALCTGIIIRKDLVVREIPLKFANLPKDLQGLRLVQLSDIHMGTFYSAADLARAVDAANGLRADLMLVTGDLITDLYDPLDRCLLELKRLRAASGIWGCLGNHEMHTHLEAYATRKAKEMGMRFLRQEVEMLQFGNAKLNLVGVDHQRRDRPYLAHTANLVVPDTFNLLLSHNPDVFPVAAKQGFDLTISGHTHGGQINLNLLGDNINVVDLVTPFTKGTYHIDRFSLYVNSGLGTIGAPVRLGAPPEVTLITLCNS